jgi:hypothetical protein
VVGFIVFAFVNAARHVIDEVFGFFDASSTVSLTSGWWTGAANRALRETILRLTVVLMLVFLLLAVLDACGTATPARSARSVSTASSAWTAVCYDWQPPLTGSAEHEAQHGRISASLVTSAPRARHIALRVAAMSDGSLSSGCRDRSFSA